MNTLKITATSEYKTAIFTWNESMTECDFNAMGVSDEEMEMLVANKVHEGANLKGWKITIA